MISLKRFFIDTSKAKDFWPKQVTSLEELPIYYHDFVKDWLNQGMPMSNIILVKQRNTWENDRPEYALAHFQERVMLLQKTPHSQVMKTVIKGTDVIGLVYHHIYLDCIVTVTFLLNRESHKVQFHFNAVAENLYVPVFNILLCNRSDHIEDIYNHDNSICSALMKKSYLMFNYGKLVYRLDNIVEKYFWDKMETEEQRKKNKKTKKRKLETEFFIALMEKGTATVKASEDHISAIYLFWNSINQIVFSYDEFGKYNINITTVTNECYKIPVQQENSSAAQSFINECNQIKKDFQSTNNL